VSDAFDLSRLLRPLSAEHFFAAHWEREPLRLKRGDPTYYDSLLTRADLEDYISSGDARYPAVRLARSGAFYPPEAYTRDVKYGDEVFRGVPDVEKIFTEYMSGATVTLPALHRIWPPLARLCTHLESELDHSVHTNAYLTPPRASGFTPHYDTHEVFVLQIAGVKHWRIYPPPLALPHRSQTFSPDRYELPARPLMELELTAGDLLYLPRGYVHTTTTAETSSAHVTIGITVYTWVELLSQLQAGSDLPELRAALPCGFAHRAQAREELSRRLGEHIERLRMDGDATAMIERLIERVRSMKSRPSARFRSDFAEVGPDSCLRVAAGIGYRVSRERDDVLLELAGRRVRLQSAVGPTLEAICQAESFTARGLSSDISLDARLALLRYLHGLGFLQQAQ
jgi:predicted small metal-binding protein